MGTKYPGVSISGYNSSPPADDGSATEANKTKWSTIKTKITDPIKTLAEAINTALATAFDYSTIDKTANYTTTAADHMKTINCDGTFTVTLGAAATMGTGYVVTIKNSGSGTITVDGNGAETIDGSATIDLGPGLAMTVTTDSGAGGYWAKGRDEFPSGTVMLFNQTAAPVGWTKGTTHNDKALRVVTGSVSTGGTDAFTTTFSASKATESHALTDAELPEHTHTLTGTSETTAAGGLNYRLTSLNTSTKVDSGGAAGHTHDITLDLQYVDVIIATKD